MIPKFSSSKPNRRDLKSALKQAALKYKIEPRYKVGLLNDKLLASLIEKIRSAPTLDNFILFTSCLNFFYSTRLQAGINKNVEDINHPNKLIIKAATVLRWAWKDRSITLKNVQSGSDIETARVNLLRKAMAADMPREAYSFTTKVFHQLNSQYPILDSRIHQFMRVEGFIYRINFFNQPYEKFYELFLNMMSEFSWPLTKIDEFDNAIWTHCGHFPKRYQR